MAYEALYTRGRPKKFAQLIGQEHIVNALTRAVSSNRLSHAFLLVGTRGTGKTSTARLLAKAMNCEKVLAAQQNGETLKPSEIPCNECAACKSIDSSPDNVEFDAASNRSVEDVTRLLSTAYLAPLQSRVKTFIIDEIHMLSNEAINSILKLIEEPPPNVAFFLATTELNKVPMTIRSRCQVLNFRLIPQEIISPYLIKLATRLGVELEEDAAKKIARLAAGSMRDAMTYLDQCYAMADKRISLENVNDTLGLVSDADLDEIISAVQAQNRAQVAKAINKTFRSGLSSIVIAESLITRLRDLEFETLDKTRTSKFQTLDNFVEAVRKAISEMQNSGIPDIILEMTLLKLAAPQIISAPQIVQNFSAAPAQSNGVLTGNLDEDKKIFYDIIINSDALPKTLSDFVKGNFEVENFSNDILTLTISKKAMFAFSEDNKLKVEKFLAQKIGRPIKIEIAVNENFKNSKLDGVQDSDKEFLKKTMDIFEVDDFTKIESED